MKYGESTFDILYLLTAVVCGIIMLIRSRNTTHRLMGLATLILGAGDAFHLVPRVIRYFSDADMTSALGIGKLITSVTMTVFYVLMYFIWKSAYRKDENRITITAVAALSCVRVIVCLFPQNGWLENSSDMLWGILRNIPFCALGVIIAFLYFTKRKEDRSLRFIWLYVTLSFLFYIPVAVFAGIVPVLGMLMLPKTVCYILIIITFLLYVIKGRGVRKDIRLKEMVISPGYGDMRGSYHRQSLKKDESGVWRYVSEDREDFREPVTVTVYSVKQDDAESFIEFLSDVDVTGLEDRPDSDMFVTDYSPWSVFLSMDAPDKGPYRMSFCRIQEYKKYSADDYKLINEIKKRFADLRGDVVSVTTEKED